MSDLAYMIVYPRGDRTKLCVVQVYSYEQNDWDLASLERFYDRDEAETYMDELATKHGLICRTSQKLLD